MKKFLKRVLVLVVLAVVLVSVCACNTVPAKRFMSNSMVKKLTNEFNGVQAEVTLSYEIRDGGVKKQFEIKIVYDLLVGQAPIAVTRFIQLANDGYYNDSIIDTYNQTYRYMVMGRYLYKDSVVSENKQNYYANKTMPTFKGEFKSNNYSEPTGGYAQFESYSLAMYHEESKSDNANFDTAQGALILALDNTLNSNNYAVFAHMYSTTYTVIDGDNVTSVEHIGKMHGMAETNLKSFTATSRRTSVYTDATEEHKLPSVTMMDQLVTVKVRILGDYDWSKLPQIGR